MNLQIHKHFDYLTPFAEAQNDTELATIMRLKYPKACGDLEIDAGFFARMVEDVRKYEAWRVIGFNCFEDFCEEKLGKTLDEVETILRGVKVLQQRGMQKMSVAEAMEAAPKLAEHGEIGRGRNRGSHSTSIRGETSRYLAARIKRDHPEIARRSEAGEFKSVRAAAIAAGIVKIKTPLEQLRYWWNKASNKERAVFMTEANP